MAQRVQQEPQEPVGIVISAGGRGEVAPRFAAFEWAPAPEDETRFASAEVKAA